MKYADFRDWFFDLLTKPYPAAKRFPFLPEGRIKRGLQQISYGIDRAIIFILIWVVVPLTVIAGLIGFW